MSDPSSPFQETSSPQPQQQMASDLANSSEIEIQVLSFPGCQQTSVEDGRSSTVEAFITQVGAEAHHQRQQQQQQLHMPAVGYVRRQSQEELSDAGSMSGYPSGGANSSSSTVAPAPSRIKHVQRVAAIKQAGPTSLEVQGSAARAVPALVQHVTGPASSQRCQGGEESCTPQRSAATTDLEVNLLQDRAEQDGEQASADEGRKRRRGRRKQVPKRQQRVDSPKTESGGEECASLENTTRVTIDDGASLPSAKRVRRLTARQKWSLEQAQELENEDVEVERTASNKPPSQWNVEEVADFIDSIDRSCTTLFREHVSLLVLP